MKWTNGKSTILISLIVLVVLIMVVFQADFSAGHQPEWGVTFSRSYALDLQLDWRATYLAILDDLDISHIRLAAYWDEIESAPNQYVFSDLDWQIEQAQARQVDIVLAIGRRLPRWPECHDPDWVKHLPPADANQAVLALLERLVKRYQANPAITAWQIENEPLFAWFGFCPPPDKDFLTTEIALVKSLDNSRPVIITDSGELSNWQAVAGLTDILGTTMYRIVWNQKLGFWDYWFIPPVFYRIKAALTQWLNPNLQQVIVTELQMEPWALNKRMVDLTEQEQAKTLDLRRFNQNIRYVKKTGFSRVYLWGVEYWCWLKEQGRPEIWQAAQQLWR